MRHEAITSPEKEEHHDGNEKACTERSKIETSFAPTWRGSRRGQQDQWPNARFLHKEDSLVVRKFHQGADAQRDRKTK